MREQNQERNVSGGNAKKQLWNGEMMRSFCVVLALVAVSQFELSILPHRRTLLISGQK